MGCKISILVPVYDVERYIERCARSLFEQTFKELEYVFVNDCTPDKSIEILKAVTNEYPQRRDTVKIVSHKRHRGPAAARNTAIDAAAGEFVCYVDSDDWIEPDAIDLLATRQIDNDADMVSGNRTVHYPEKSDVFQEPKYQSKEAMTLQMMQHTWDHFITGRLIRKSLFDDYGLRFNEGLDVAEDRYMMTLLAYHASCFDTVDTVVYHYERRNENAITIGNDKNRVYAGNRQELENILVLKRFFEDKEDIFRKESARCVIDQLWFNLNTALAYSSKKEFYKIVGEIDSSQDYGIKLVSWQKNYTLMRMNWLKGKTVRFIKKRVKTGV